MKQLEQLVEDLKTDESLREQLLAAGKDRDAFDAVLHKAGYEVVGADIEQLYEQRKKEELSDEELDAVAGGYYGDMMSAYLQDQFGFSGQCAIQG